MRGEKKKEREDRMEGSTEKELGEREGYERKRGRGERDGVKMEGGKYRERVGDKQPLHTRVCTLLVMACAPPLLSLVAFVTSSAFNPFNR